MDVGLTLRNYRPFTDTNPARLSLRKGFTAFVGVNNAGKSSLLKFFYECRGLLHDLSAVDSFRDTMRGATRSFQLASVPDHTEMFSYQNSRNTIISIDYPPSSEVPRRPDRVVRLEIEIPRGENVYRLRELRTEEGALGINQDYQTVSADDGLFLVLSGKRVAHLSPHFSGLRPLSQTFYLPAFRNAINIGGEKPYFDIQVGTSLLRHWRRLKTGHMLEHNRKALELRDHVKRVFSLSDLEINTADDESTLLVVVDGHPFRLETLGSGLAQFILVLANVMIQRPAYILIDEPELNLHPSLQQDFLITLAGYALEGVLFATHSMGLARALGERIYTVRQQPDKSSVVALIEHTADLAELLGELNFSGYRELGFKRILLVEGPTEVTAVQQLLRKWNADHKIVLLPLGGSSMINGRRVAELAEITRITTDVHALIDSEKTSASTPLSEERHAFVGACKSLGVKCEVLPRRAFENHLCDRAIKKVKGEKYGALGSFQSLEEVSPSWAKTENWRIAQEMTKDEIYDVGLGRLLDIVVAGI